MGTREQQYESLRERFARRFDEGREPWLDALGRPDPVPGVQRTNVGDMRHPARRDRDRVIYSSSLQRLGDVTQILQSAATSTLLHNRLTHTLRVAQVARAI